MDRNKNIIPYSASDIEKYRKGQLSAPEMHELELAALDDPFLADAIDGLTPHPTLVDDLSDLRERLDQKVTADARHFTPDARQVTPDTRQSIPDNRRGKIRRVQRRIAIAAAFIFLLGIGFTFFNHRNNNLKRTSEPTTVAVNTAPSAAKPATEPKAAADSIVLNYSLADRARPTTTLGRRLPATTAKSAGNLSTGLPTTDKTSTSTSNQASTSNQVSVVASNQRFAPAAESVSVNPPINYLNNATPLVFSGKVLDLHDHPLAGAFLAFNGNSGYGAITDDQGQFRISLHPRDSTRQLIVSMIGYDHASLAVNALSTEGQSNNIIRLRPSTAALDEVVVVGYGAHRKETEVAAPSDSDEKLDTLWNNAAPVIGRQAYLQYLGVAKKKLGLDTAITGTETVSFVVARNGSFSGFKIEQSLSPAHDAGILRLVTDGPAWHLIRGKKVRASVTVNF